MIHFITYGDSVFEKSKNRIFNEATSSGWFDTVSKYGPEDIDDNFKNRFKNVLSSKRGGGYWIWKPYFIKNKLNEINDGDILIYLDAGCTINKQGGLRFQEYIEMLNNSDEGTISFLLDRIERNYTSKKIFDYLDVDINSDIANNSQTMATILILKKNSKTIKLVEIWNNVLYNDPLLFTDAYNKKEMNHKDFIDNRHDQSIFSIIRKKNGSLMLDDETWFGGYDQFGKSVSKKFPFWSTRRK